MKRVMVIYGTRPEAIKMAPLIRSLESCRHVDPLVVVTGQHREMLDQVNELFSIVPKHDLDVMVPGASLTDLAARTVAATGAILNQERPDAVVVQGDTTSALTAAMAAFYNEIPVIHLEAGLRSGVLSSPFPEEGNRRMTAAITDLHLAPTVTSRDNLLREGILAETIAVTGNTVIDALNLTLAVPGNIPNSALGRLLKSKSRFVLVTAHRRESWGRPMAEAMRGVADAAAQLPDISFVVPLHRNPDVRSVIRGGLVGLTNVIFTEPLDYHEFVHTMARAYMLLTDSGGVQEEAPTLGKPVLVMRDTTERPEAVSAGTVRLVGTNRASVGLGLVELLTDPVEYSRMANAINPYGDGKAADRCVGAIQQLLGVGTRLPDFAPLDMDRI